MVMMMMMIFVCHNERSYDTNTWTLFNRHKSVDPHLRTMLSICDFSELFVCMWNRCLFPFYLIASNFNDFHLNFCDTLKCDLFDQLFFTLLFIISLCRTLVLSPFSSSNIQHCSITSSYFMHSNKTPTCQRFSTSNSLLINFCNCINSILLYDRVNAIQTGIIEKIY